MPGENSQINVSLSLQEAEAAYEALEETLEKGSENPALKKAYRTIGWRILANKGGTGLTAQMAEIARRSESLEEYEANREQALGPILEGLQRGENRDP